MSTKGVAIKYSDVAPDAKENFVPTVSEKENFVNLSQLQQYNLKFPNYSNPCELYSVLLDGTAEVIPYDMENLNLGLWSVQTTDDNGRFDTPIVLTLTASRQYSSQGITLTFDEYNNIYANNLNIQWYRADDLLSDMNFKPDKAVYFCRNKIENYDKLIITFYSLNMPQNRLKLRVIDYGYNTVFYGDELRTTSLIQEIDPISSEISINTADFTIDSKTDIDYTFQTKQLLAVYFNGELQATTFVKTSNRTSKTVWNVKSEDYIGLMENIPYVGGIYNNAEAVDIINDIFTVAKIPYSIDENFNDVTVTGHIPYTTCREALMQVVFAIQAVVDTSNSEIVKIYALNDEVKQTIPLERLQGESFTDSTVVTGVELTVHTYITSTESTEAYKAENSGTGNNIFVSFSEPLHDLTITNGTITESGKNYAVINANSNCILTGKKYTHTTQIKRKNNPVVLANAVENIIAIDRATLISSSNADMVLEKCYNYLVKTKTINAKIVEGKHTDEQGNVTYEQVVNLGDVLTLDTQYLGQQTARLISSSFSLVGGIKVKQCILK